MSSFINAPVKDVGTAERTIHTVPANTKAILIGCNLANKTGGILPVSIWVRSQAGDFSIVKNKRVGNGENEEIMRGNKMVLVAGDSLMASAGDDNAFDVIASVLTGVA